MFCVHCGQEIRDEAVICPFCGCTVSGGAVANGEAKSSYTAAKIFMIISCVIYAFSLIPLAWCIPMTVHLYRVAERGETPSTAFKICSLLFVNTIAGILMLCDK